MLENLEGNKGIDWRIILKCVLGTWIGLGYGLGDRGFESRQGLRIVLFTTASRPALVLTQSPIQWVPGALSLGIKEARHEVDHSSPSSAEVKNACSYTSTPQYAFMALCSVKKEHRVFVLGM
jgi:hypothetical protein